MIALAEIFSARWVVFIIAVLFFLALDLGVFHRRAHVVRFREALIWTGIWFACAMLFAWVVAPNMVENWRRQETDEFITGYILELSLSMDNVFVIALIFTYFRVPPEYQHRVLFWGILGALVMRGLMIWGGVELVQRFEWMFYVFGVFLILTAGKMIFGSESEVHPERNIAIRVARKFFPVAAEFDGQKFFTRLNVAHPGTAPEPSGVGGAPISDPAHSGSGSTHAGSEPGAPGTVAECTRLNGRRALTPLALVLLMVETTDLIFAVDSIPAIIGVTQNRFIVFTSNVFAILGLRSLYFVLAGAIQYFRYLKIGLAAVLAFIGAKMLLAHTDYKVSTQISLWIVAAIISLSILVSLLAAWRERKAPPAGSPPA